MAVFTRKSLTFLKFWPSKVSAIELSQWSGKLLEKKLQSTKRRKLRPLFIEEMGERVKKNVDVFIKLAPIY